MYNIKIPPLRERKDDILPLAKHFLKIHTGRIIKKFRVWPRIWPKGCWNHHFLAMSGNLENIIAGAVLLERGKTLTLASARNLLPYNGPERRKNVELLTLDELERRHIKRVLEITGGNRPKAAKILGINVSTVYRKLEKFNLVENY